ncbi:hypothetical protein MK163_11090 [bacterium]|nr:hypothetical protein [bacterium]
MIRDNVETAFRVVELNRGDCLRVLDRAAEWSIVGGTVYGAIIARAAEKVKVDKLLTFNVRHFRRVWPESGDIIQEP